MDSGQETSTPCDLCGVTEAHPLPQAETYGSGGVYVCANCGFVHVKERRPTQEVAKAWDEIYGEGYTSKWPAVFARLQYVCEWYHQKFSWTGKSVLEIGAGEGSFLKLVRNRGALVVGVEPFEKNCRRMEAEGMPVFHGAIEDVQTDQKFDVVCILWTLENCSDCLGMLKKAKSLLNPGGRVLVATGSRILVPFKKPIRTYFSNNPPDTHCYRWSANSLMNALITVGLGTIEINDFEQCDWMVVAASEGEANAVKDDPEAVLAYFDAWESLPV